MKYFNFGQKFHIKRFCFTATSAFTFNRHCTKLKNTHGFYAAEVNQPEHCVFIFLTKQSQFENTKKVHTKGELPGVAHNLLVKDYFPSLGLNCIMN